MTAPHIIALHLDVPITRTLTAWAVLVAGVLGGLLVLIALAWSQDPIVKRRRAERRRRRLWQSPVVYARLVAEAQELAREATATSDRAQQAADVVAEAQSRHEAAQQARDAAAGSFDEARRAHAEAMAAWQAWEKEREQEKEHVPDDSGRLTAGSFDDSGSARLTPRRDPEIVVSPRPLAADVSRAALLAFRRGDISFDELREVFRRTGHWDPAQQERERTIGALRAEARRTHREYDIAAAAERIATNEFSVAEIAAHATAEEAAQAAADATVAREVAEECGRALSETPKRRPRRFPRRG